MRTEVERLQRIVAEAVIEFLYLVVLDDQPSTQPGPEARTLSSTESSR
jgi:hypothetical protein